MLRSTLTFFLSPSVPRFAPMRDANCKRMAIAHLVQSLARAASCRGGAGQRVIQREAKRAEEKCPSNRGAFAVSSSISVAEAEPDRRRESGERLVIALVRREERSDVDRHAVRREPRAAVAEHVDAVVA